jgi:hypothetical protein
MSDKDRLRFAFHNIGNFQLQRSVVKRWAELVLSEEALAHVTSAQIVVTGECTQHIINQLVTTQRQGVIP